VIALTSIPLIPCSDAIGVYQIEPVKI